MRVGFARLSRPAVRIGLSGMTSAGFHRHGQASRNGGKQTDPPAARRPGLGRDEMLRRTELADTKRQTAVRWTFSDI